MSRPPASHRDHETTPVGHREVVVPVRTSMLVAIGASPRCGHRRLRRVLDPGHVPRLFALHEPLKDGQQEPRHTETDRTQCDLTTTPRRPTHHHRRPVVPSSFLLGIRHLVHRRLHERRAQDLGQTAMASHCVLSQQLATRKEPRALTEAERVAWRSQLEADDDAVRKDLPDLTDFMVATGVRIGEALAVLWSEVDLDKAIVPITSTIIRVTGEGLIRKTTKSRAGQRMLSLQPACSSPVPSRTVPLRGRLRLPRRSQPTGSILRTRHPPPPQPIR